MSSPIAEWYVEEHGHVIAKCPECGKWGTLARGVHTIAVDGSVSPSFDCPVCQLAEAESKRLRWEIARLVVCLRPLAALAPAYSELALDGAAIVTVGVFDSDSERNVQLLPAHAIAAAAALADVGRGMERAETMAELMPKGDGR